MKLKVSQIIIKSLITSIVSAIAFIDLELLK